MNKTQVKCIICGDTFMGRIFSKYCPKCKHKVARKNYLNYVERHKVNILCPKCGTTTVNSRRVKSCNKCKEQAKLNRIKETMQRTCIVCGKKLWPTRKKSKYCLECSVKKQQEKEKQKYLKCRMDKEFLEHRHEYQKNRIKMNKTKVIEHYSNGNNCCKMCGEKYKPMLQIDHINNDGYKFKDKHGNRIEKGDRLYNILIKNGYPEGYQVLCAACNIKKYWDNYKNKYPKEQIIKVKNA